MNSAEVDEVKRHFNVVAEGLRSEIRLLAEAVTAVDQKVDRLEVRMEEQFEETRAMIRLS